MGRDLVIGMAGSGGDGVVSAGEALTVAAAAAGYHVIMTKSFGSQIRGGESSCRVRVSSEPIFGCGGTLDVAVALNWADFLKFDDELPVGSEPPPAPERTLRPWVLWASGAALLGVGIGFGASSAAARSRASRPLGPESEAIYIDAADRAQSHAVVADVSFALSGLTVAAGGLIYWLESD